MKIILKNTKLEFQSGTFDVEPYVEGGDAGIWNTANKLSEDYEFKDVILDSENRVLWGRYQEAGKSDYAPNLRGYTIDGVSVQRIVDAIVSELS